MRGWGHKPLSRVVALLTIGYCRCSGDFALGNFAAPAVGGASVTVVLLAVVAAMPPSVMCLFFFWRTVMLPRCVTSAQGKRGGKAKRVS